MAVREASYHAINLFVHGHQKTREFVASRPKKLNAKGKEHKSNVTDNDSAKMATSKGVIQG